MEEYSNHKVVYELLQACLENQLRHIVISPGSRNAPLILTFAKHSQIQCYSIVDERAAAFFALGLSQQLRAPVALACTSGTAVLNYAPAVAEAYEQNIPLVVLSADRPKELINQAEGQSIRQEGVLGNIVERSYQLPSGNTARDIAYAHRLCAEALAICRQKQRPVHINIPLWEPLYEKQGYIKKENNVVHFADVKKQLTDNELVALSERLNSTSKVLILVGFLPENSELNTLLEQLVKAKKAVVLTESIANLKSLYFHYNIDCLLSAMHEKEAFVPDILITLGGTLISKMVKQWLRICKPKEHWHLNSKDYCVDTFQCLTMNIPVAPTTFFGQLKVNAQQEKNSYVQLWEDLAQQAKIKHSAYMKKLIWSDFQAFESILKAVPQESLLHLGNSTVVRYHQLFPYNSQLHYASNRGTSGIDGCTSTAVGGAFIFNGYTTLITGDISLGYDSNALWHQYVSPKLRIIVINNGGGGIFRFLEDASKQDELETFFETTHSVQSYEHLAAHWGIKYSSVSNQKDLQTVLQDFYKEDGARLLEIKTPQFKNAEVLRGYFKYLKEK